MSPTKEKQNLLPKGSSYTTAHATSPAHIIHFPIQICDHTNSGADETEESAFIHDLPFLLASFSTGAPQQHSLLAQNLQGAFHTLRGWEKARNNDIKESL